ncbi:MFS transporter [Arthrobacter sp. JZ12]|uniref:MFS transporter n=1 Tax=Arthrobacter sp. JZ12 TaxID=2654190 RepID=UPI002B4608A9|nr:MFS transporter [Arthrobacter sp. JZ12]WRH25963.1 MFS transporter [Arthrobacter sp. JZ12]
MTEPLSGRPVTTLLQAVSVTTTGVLPAFLLGALAVQIRDDLDLGPAQMGIAAAILFAVSGTLARPLGGVVQRMGAGRGMVLSAALATVALAGAGAAPTFPVLVAALFIGGLANATAQPSANLGISRSIGSNRLGLAFGVKQSSIPAASLLGGLAVPGIALVLGWRYAFFAGAVLALCLAGWALLRGQAQGTTTAVGEARDRGTPRGGLVVLTIGAGLAAAAATSLGVFLVDSMVQAGIAPGTAGLIFAGAAVLGLGIRILLGTLMDRMPTRSPYVLMANLLVAGVVGYLLLSVGTPALMVAGTLLAYSAGWTWPGLLHFAVVRDNRLAAASATGVVQTGLSLGAAGGPLLFGLLVSATSYSTAWVVAGVVALAAALTFRIARRMIRKSRGLPVPNLFSIRNRFTPSVKETS